MSRHLLQVQTVTSAASKLAVPKLYHVNYRSNCIMC